MSRLNRFPHLKLQREFDRVYRRADKVWHTPWFVIFFKKSSNPSVAYVAGKKVGNAVARNRAKRRLRALFRNKVEFYQTGTYILVAKPPILNVEYSNLKEAWEKALYRCRVLQR